MILGVLPGHEKAEVIEFLRLIPLRIAQTVQTVCCDLWEAYTEAAREELPSARIVADRFHVAKHYRHAADEVPLCDPVRFASGLLHSVGFDSS